MNILDTTVELWSLELACLEHNGSLELIRRSRRIPYIFNVKMPSRLDRTTMARTLELKTRTAGQFLMYKHMADSNQYLPNMNHSDAGY